MSTEHYVSDVGRVIADAIETCFLSFNETDGEEPGNVVRAFDRIARSITQTADAISPTGALPMRTPGGGRVGSLSEAVVFAAENIGRVADAIGDLASAVRESGR